MLNSVARNVVAQVETAKGILLFLWLVLLAVAHAPAAVVHSSENRVWQIFSTGYDAESGTNINYDGPLLRIGLKKRGRLLKNTVLKRATETTIDIFNCLRRTEYDLTK